MKQTPWDVFATEKLKKIFRDGNSIIDIGGGLRLRHTNRVHETNCWLLPYLERVDYKIVDKVADYQPDIVGDIHHLPLSDNSIDAVICLAVLEHVEEPTQAMREIHRVLKPGGYAYIYVPFLYYYHPLPGYYKDFYRFTYDGVRYMTRQFSAVEIQNVRGALATVANLIPQFSKRTRWWEWLDRRLGKETSKQTSGYNIFCIK